MNCADLLTQRRAFVQGIPLIPLESVWFLMKMTTKRSISHQFVDNQKFGFVSVPTDKRQEILMSQLANNLNLRTELLNSFVVNSEHMFHSHRDSVQFTFIDISKSTRSDFVCKTIGRFWQLIIWVLLRIRCVIYCTIAKWIDLLE